MGDAFDFRSISCPTCGQAPQRVVGLRGGIHHRFGSGVPCRIVRCRRCGLLFPNPFPYPQDSQSMYGDPDKYFESHDSAGKTQAHRRTVRDAIALTGKAAPSVLDVGSGLGEFLAAARDEGLTDVTGLELSEAMIEAAGRRGLTVVPELIEEHASTAGRFYDVVVLSAVLEHVHDPDSMIDAVARLTHGDSWVFVDVPCEPNLLTVVGNSYNRLKGSQTVLNLSPTFLPFHVYGFNRRSLGALLVKHGFRIRSCRVASGTQVPTGPGAKGKAQALAARAVLMVANVTGTATNMGVWAAKDATGELGAVHEGLTQRKRWLRSMP